MKKVLVLASIFVFGNLLPMEKKGKESKGAITKHTGKEIGRRRSASLDAVDRMKDGGAGIKGAFVKKNSGSAVVGNNTAAREVSDGITWVTIQEKDLKALVNEKGNLKAEKMSQESLINRLEEEIKEKDDDMKKRCCLLAMDEEVRQKFLDDYAAEAAQQEFSPENENFSRLKNVLLAPTLVRIDIENALREFSCKALWALMASGQKVMRDKRSGQVPVKTKAERLASLNDFIGESQKKIAAAEKRKEEIEKDMQGEEEEGKD